MVGEKKEEEKKGREKKTQRDTEASANPPRMCTWEHRTDPIRVYNGQNTVNMLLSFWSDSICYSFPEPK